MGLLFLFIYSIPFDWRILLSSLLPHAVANIVAPVLPYFKLNTSQFCWSWGLVKLKWVPHVVHWEAGEAGGSSPLPHSWWGELFPAREFLFSPEQYGPGRLDEAGKWSFPSPPFCATILRFLFHCFAEVFFLMDPPELFLFVDSCLIVDLWRKWRLESLTGPCWWYPNQLNLNIKNQGFYVSTKYLLLHFPAPLTLIFFWVGHLKE